MTNTYVFSTVSGSGAQAVVPVGSFIPNGATLTVEFSADPTFGTVTLSKPLTLNGTSVTVSLTTTEVDLVKDDVYRIKSVKGALTEIVATGRVKYTPAVASAADAATLRADFAPKWSPQSVPGAAGLPRLMANPPTFAYVNRWFENASPVPNAKFVPAILTPDISAGQTPKMNTAAFSFRGGLWQQKGTNYPSMFTANQKDLAGESGNYPYVEFVYYGSDFEFGYFAQGWLATRVWVDGQLAENVFTSSDPANGDFHFRRVTFAAPGWRHIRLDIQPNGFYGVFTGPADVVIAPPTPSDRLLVIGDSFAEGTGSNGFDGYPMLLGQMLGFGEVIGAAQGGTGVLAVGSPGMGRTNYIGRAAAWEQIGATHVLIQMSGNDHAFTDAELAQAVRNLIPVLEALPGHPELWFVGMWANNVDANTLAAQKDAIVRPIIESAGHLFVSQVEPTSIWSGTGHVGAPAGNGTCDVLVGADGTHPTQAGHEGIARNLYARLLAALA